MSITKTLILININILDDARESFLLSDGTWFGKNIIIYGVDLSSTVHVDNRKKRYLNSW